MNQQAQKVVTHFENRGYEFVFNRSGKTCYLAEPDFSSLIAVNKCTGTYDLVLWSSEISKLFDKKFTN